MNKLIIIRGPLGIGKSTISKNVAKEIGATYHSIDTVLEENKLDIIHEGEPCISQDNFLKANKIIIPTIKEELEKQSVVIDGNFYWQEAIDNLINTYNNVESVVITLKADVKTCIQRDSQRTHPHGEGAAIAVYNLVSKFDAGYIVNNEKDANTAIHEILKIIKE